MPVATIPPQYNPPLFSNQALIEGQFPPEALTTLATQARETATPTAFDTIAQSEGRPTYALGDQQATVLLPQIAEEVLSGLITTEGPGIYTTNTGDTYSIVTVVARDGRFVDVPVSESGLENPNPTQLLFIEKQGPDLAPGENAIERFYGQYGETTPEIVTVGEGSYNQLQELARQIAITGEATILMGDSREVTDSEPLHVARYFLGLYTNNLSAIREGYGEEAGLNSHEASATMLLQLPGEEMPRLLVVSAKYGDPDPTRLKVDPVTNEVYSPVTTIQLSAVEAKSLTEIGTTLSQARQLNGLNADHNTSAEQVARDALRIYGTYTEQGLHEMDMTKFSGSPVLRRFYRMMGLNYKDYEKTHKGLADLGTKFFTTIDEDNVSYGIRVPVTETNHREEGGVHVISIQLDGHTITLPMASTGDAYYDTGQLTDKAELIIERSTNDLGEFYWKAAVIDSNTTGRAPFHAPNERFAVLLSYQPPEVTNNKPGEKNRSTLQMSVADIFDSKITVGPNENSILYELGNVPRAVDALTYLGAHYIFGSYPEVVVPFGDVENPQVTVSKAIHTNEEGNHFIDIVINTPSGQIRLRGENNEGFPEDTNTREIQKLSLIDTDNTTGSYLMRIAWPDGSYTIVHKTDLVVYWTGLSNGPTWLSTSEENGPSTQPLRGAGYQVSNRTHYRDRRYQTPPSVSRTNYTARQPGPQRGRR